MKQKWAALILFATGLFLLTRLATGTLFFYINQRFTWLILLAIAGFALVGVSYLFNRAVADPRSEADRDNHHDHDHEHKKSLAFPVRSSGLNAEPRTQNPELRTLNPHHHDHSHGLSWGGLLLVAMPVILGFLVPPQPLGAAAMENREVNVGALSSLSLPGQSEKLILHEKEEKDIMDWLVAFQRSRDLTEFRGEKAHVVGFVYRDGRFEGYDDNFMVSRFALTCCVADATAIGLIVQWPDAVNMDKDEWVEVKGAFKIGEFYGQQLPVLVAEAITPTEAPEQPYLYYY